VKLDAWTQAVLKNFSAYNEGMLFVPGAVQTTRGLHAVGFAYLKQEFPREFAIANLATLRSALDLFKEPDIEFGERSLKVSGPEGDLEYGYAEKDTVKYFDVNKKIPVNQDCQFTVKWDQVAQVLDAASSLSLPEIAFQGKKGRLSFRTWNSKKPGLSGFSIDLGEASQDFAVVFPLEDLKFIPKDYAVTLSWKKIAKFDAIDKDGNPEVTYYVGASEASEVP
jgi:hypothetical protein